MTFASNDTWDSQLMELQDGVSTYTWSFFTGGTILRSIVDYVITPTVDGSPASNYTQEAWVWLGFGLSDDTSPNQDQWDPNDPHAPFMWRGGHVDRFYGRLAGAAPFAWHSSSGGGMVHADVTQRRRIGENMRMWNFGHYFAPNEDHGLAVGFSGRILIQLP